MSNHPIRTTLTMEVTASMEKTIIEAFNLEIEVLQGMREPMLDGRTRFTITINDKQKSDIVREFILKLISQSHLVNPN